MGMLERWRTAYERRRQRRVDRRPERVERARRKAEADSLRVEHKRRHGATGGDGGAF